MRIEQETLLDFKDVLIRPKRSTLKSRQDVNLIREFKFKWSKKTYAGVPIIASNMDGVGTFSMAKEMYKHSMSVALRKHYGINDLIAFNKTPEGQNQWYTFGITKNDLDKLNQMTSEMKFNYVCIDVANGYTEDFVNTIKQIRMVMPEIVIMAGNVVTGDMTEALILAGADVVKVGIGPGSVCTTRRVAGVGYPQLSAIMECADAAHGLGGLICADGGCQYPGDISKAFGAGADFVMLGGMLAGHNEGEYEVFYSDFGEKFYTFYGMSSDTAQQAHMGGVKNYRTSEGRTVRLEPRGPVEPTLLEIMGGVRSMMTYIGARSLKEVSKRTSFVRVSRQLNDMFD